MTSRYLDKILIYPAIQVQCAQNTSADVLERHTHASCGRSLVFIEGSTQLLRKQKGLSGTSKYITACT